MDGCNALDQIYMVKRINSEHKDLLHDVSFDFFGKRMATCSSDQSVKIWDVDENGEWHCTASWKTHSASVWKVTWAHPEFGQVLATCSFDRTAAIWEETVVENSSSQTERVWVHKVSLVDSRTSVKDVKFAPKHLGLQLATCSSNGIIRIYEAPDVMNLTHWSLQNQIQCKISCSCLSWNPSTHRNHLPMIAVGSDDPSSSGGGKVFIFEYNDQTRDWSKVLTIMSMTDAVSDLCFAPNLGRKHHVLAVASEDLHIFTIKPSSNETSTSSGTPPTYNQVAHFTDHCCKVVNVAWNDLGTIVISSGDDGHVYLWMANYLGIWRRVGELKKDLSPPSDMASPPVEKSDLSPLPVDGNRINFRRFTQGRAPPTERPLDPKFAGAYY
uniref:Nucleoporin seh1-like n=1 Tax=Phallusia mammillata TaxID=59560 RepID=A0A6F9DR70_9ASCI|nr:nucleoporin seh1-like [Phallusia mammillata]